MPAMNDDYRPDKVAQEIPEGELRAERDFYRRRADKLNEFCLLTDEIWGERQSLPDGAAQSAATAHDCSIELAEWYEAVQWEIEDRMDELA